MNRTSSPRSAKAGASSAKRARLKKSKTSRTKTQTKAKFCFSSKSYRCKLMKITPAFAEAALSTTKHNRPLRKRLVQQYAADMKNGAWNARSGQTIAFNQKGLLIDGQHRLHAIIALGRSVSMMVAFGCDPEAFQRIDGHARRGSNDLYVLKGGNAPLRNFVVSAARAMYFGLEVSHGLSTIQTSDLARRWEDRIVPVLKVLLQNKALYHGSVVAAFAKASFTYEMEGVLQLAEDYALQRYEGDGDPLRALQNRLIRHKLSQRGVHGRLDRHYVYALAVRAIRAALEGETLEKVYPATKDFAMPETRS